MAAVPQKRPILNDAAAEHGEILPSSQPTRRKISHQPIAAQDKFHTIHDLIRIRASDRETQNTPLIFYPRSGTDYVGYSPADLLRLSAKAATYYDAIIPRRKSSDEPPQVVALLGTSDLDYLVSVLSLSRLGHTVLFLSTRISEEAHVSLLSGSCSVALFTGNGFISMGERVRTHLPGLQIGFIASRKDFEDFEEISDSGLTGAQESKNVAWIIHSSGSTSLPRPISQTHSAALGNFRSPFILTGFVTLPLFHMQGLGCVFRSIMNCKPIFMYNATLPLAIKHLNTTLREHPEIEILYGVPYALKLLAESKEGIELCRKLQVLFTGGSACPKPIGDKLAQAGVNVVSHFGSSETGQLMNSYRPPEELEEWDWLRPYEAASPYIRWEPYDKSNNIFELVVLEGWPSKAASNREDGAYATSDLWERHPGFPEKNAWRYYARKDDTIVLVNGEKANPILFEDVAKESPLVEDAVVFGSQKPRLGIFIVPCNATTTQEEISDAIWPHIESANKRVPAHAQLSKDMIRILLPKEAEKIRKTDKSSLIRPAFYRDFAGHIDAVYEEADAFGSLVLDEDELRDFLRKEVLKVVESSRQHMVENETDLFSLGIDSLQASRIRASVKRNIDTGPHALSENIVFDFPSISAMATELLRMKTGETQAPVKSAEEKMQALIDKYSLSFLGHNPVANPASNCQVVVTGATGSLGAHLIAQILKRSEISTIVCLVRARSNEVARERLRLSMEERCLEIDDRVRVYASDFADPLLGLSAEDYKDVSKALRCVFHCAWTVNFNLSLESLEGDCIKGTRHLLDLCLKTIASTPADFFFCSSVSAVANSPAASIPEELPPSLSYAQNMGYAQSKLVAEHLCLRAAKNLNISVKILRIGQIVGDTHHGIWNPQEAIPMIIRSAKTVGSLPKLNERCSWLPVDTVAKSFVQLWLDDESEKTEVFHIVNCKTFDWNTSLLPKLKKAGLHFEAVDQVEWLKRLKDNPDPVANPPYKLIDFFESKYGGDKAKRDVGFSTNKSTAASTELRQAPEIDQEMVNKFVRFFEDTWERQKRAT